MPTVASDPFEVRLFGRTLLLKSFTSGALYKALKAGHAWEGHIGGQFFPNLRDDTVFFDIGANIGYYSILASPRITTGKVVAVEPNPQILPVLRENIRLNGASNVVIEPQALGAGSGQVHVRFDEDEPGASHVSDAGAAVAMTTLDDLTATHGTPTIIKLDAEGLEGDIVHGGARTFETGRPYVFMEFAPPVFHRSTHRLDRMILWLDSIGYQFRFFRGHTHSATEPITAAMLVDLGAYWTRIGHQGHMDILIGRDLHAA